ncbi:MAG: phosphotransferase [Anaerolineae bacterium]|nr:phosphotransferase [Anaerolineae bacterium]MDQ7036998.1 phosphotransferase [Anaerolineae bacterium]
MTQFEDMTEEEQKAWWMQQAKILLKGYLPDAQIAWLAYTHNAVFDVVHKRGHFVLRVHDKNDMRQVTSEETILMQLNTSQLSAPKPIQVMSDENTTTVGLLLTHLDGMSQTAKTVSLPEMQAIGNYLAKMHKVSFQAENRPTLDYRGLFGKNGVYHLSDESRKVFTDEQIIVMDTVAEKVKLAMDELGASDSEFGLIHGDFLLKNILFHEGDVRALDFEYCGWGYYLYDLTPLLWQLKPQDRYPELEQALWDGYSSIRPLNTRHRELLETFIAARQVASMRWVAANRHNPAYQGKVEGIMGQRTAELRGFLETGVLKRK